MGELNFFKKEGIRKDERGFFRVDSKVLKENLDSPTFEKIVPDLPDIDVRDGSLSPNRWGADHRSLLKPDVIPSATVSEQGLAETTISQKDLQQALQNPVGLSPQDSQETSGAPDVRRFPRAPQPMTSISQRGLEDFSLHPNKLEEALRNPVGLVARELSPTEKALRRQGLDILYRLRREIVRCREHNANRISLALDIVQLENEIASEADPQKQRVQKRVLDRFREQYATFEEHQDTSILEQDLARGEAKFRTLFGDIPDEVSASK